MNDNCPECGYESELSTNIEDDSIRPKNGDISFCINCGSANMFSDKGIVKVNESELSEDAKMEISRIRAAWRRTRRSNSMAG